MIAFGSSILDPKAYRRYARPGIELAAEHDSQIMAFAAVGAISRASNLLLEAAARNDELEALVLVGQDVEIVDGDLCAKVRRILADGNVAIAGCVGASGVRTLAWWDGAVSRGPLAHRYTDHGGGEIPAFAWTNPEPAPADVEAVDGSLLVLSPWAVRNLRFDEALHLGHGYDVDFCRQARAAGRRIVTADLRAVLHRPLELVSDPELWVEAHIAFAAKWDRAEADEAGWKRRARRAEAEREAARTMAYTNALLTDARALPLERALAEATAGPSWRLTAPLRRLNRLRRRLAR